MSANLVDLRKPTAAAIKLIVVNPTTAIRIELTLPSISIAFIVLVQ